MGVDNSREASLFCFPASQSSPAVHTHCAALAERTRHIQLYPALSGIKRLTQRPYPLAHTCCFVLRRVHLISFPPLLLQFLITRRTDPAVETETLNILSITGTHIVILEPLLPLLQYSEQLTVNATFEGIISEADLLHGWLDGSNKQTNKWEGLYVEPENFSPSVPL